MSNAASIFFFKRLLFISKVIQLNILNCTYSQEFKFVWTKSIISLKKCLNLKCRSTRMRESKKKNSWIDQLSDSYSVSTITNNQSNLVIPLILLFEVDINFGYIESTACKLIKGIQRHFYQSHSQIARVSSE